jgi:hypothetical protein
MDEVKHGLRFWLSPWQVVDAPDVAVPASGECSNPRSSLGAGTGAAGLRSGDTTHAAQVSGGVRFPRRPHHL